MEEKDLKQLIQKYLKEECTAAEKAYLENWYAQLNEENNLVLSEQFLMRAGKKMKKSVFQRINKADHGSRFNFRLLAASMAALLLILTGVYFYFGPNNRNKIATDVQPGSNKAILILADGSSLNLDSVQTGQIALQSGSKIVKLDNGNLVYNPEAKLKGVTTGIIYNTFKVPLGGKYNITLPDGTKVWLNSGSSLKFPTSFAHLKQRRVFLEGEAYFEVFHDKLHPFYVKTARQEARVLETHFDIEAYPENEAVKTTLLQGSLRVISELSRDSCLLVPGKQAVLTDKLKVRDVDIDAVMDWKDGYFIFDNEAVQDIVTKVARWYNVEVVYESHVENVKLDGIISRNTPLSEVLALLSATNKVNFEIRDKVLYVVK